VPGSAIAPITIDAVGRFSLITSVWSSGVVMPEISLALPDCIAAAPVMPV
jgi:hypothetical protein